MSVPPAPRDGDPGDIKMLRAAMSEASIVIHGPPDFPANAEILGVCGVSAENADQNKYGWMVLDFLMWKSLFHGVGNASAQTWLSSLDLQKFLGGNGVDMSEDTPAKNIADAVNGHLTGIPSEVHEFMAAFLKQVAESARSAAARKTTLVIMVFTPVTPEHDICVDFDNPSVRSVYLPTKRIETTICDAVGDQLPVILVTPSAFTGGWLCRPWFMGQPGCSSSDTMMRMIAKSCGGAFAERFIETFTNRGTPLLSDAQRKNVKYDDMMPIGPTQLQTDLLHQFQRQIHESLAKRLSVLARQHTLVLSQDDAEDIPSHLDSWTSVAPRQGRSMRFWAKRLRIPRPIIEGADRFEVLGEAFGGSRDSQLYHLRYLAGIELDTCPGDWNKLVIGTTRQLLRDLLQIKNPDEEKVKRVFDAIEFRASSMVLAQTIARAYDLPLPDNVNCRYWNDTTEGVDDEYYLKLQTAFGELNSMFAKVPVPPSEMRHDFKNARFFRAVRWLSAAIALKFAQSSRQDVSNFASKDVARMFAKIQDTQKALLLENQAVKCAGLEWLAAIGLVEKKNPKEAILSNGGASAPGLNNESHNGAALPSSSLNAQAGEFAIKQATATETTTRQGPAKQTMLYQVPAKRNTVIEATVAQSPVKEPTVEQVTVKQSTVERDTVEQPTFKQPTVTQSAVKELIVKQSTVKQATVEQATVEQIDLISGEDTHLEQFGETESATNGPVLHTGQTGSGLAPGKKEHVVQDLLDHFEVQPQVQPVVQDEVEDLLALEDDKINEPVVPSTSAVSAPPTNEDAQRLITALMSGTLPGFANLDISSLSQLILKAAEGKSKAQGAAENVWDASGESSVLPKHRAVNAEKASGALQGTGKANRTPVTPIPKAGITSTGHYDSSPDPTLGHSRVDSLDVKMNNTTMNNVPTPPQTPIHPHLASVEEMIEDNEDDDLMEVASPQKPAALNGAAARAGSSTSQNNLAAGDDFWARAGIKW